MSVTSKAAFEEAREWRADKVRRIKAMAFSRSYGRISTEGNFLVANGIMEAVRWPNVDVQTE
jgi:hypothetical protein